MRAQRIGKGIVLNARRFNGQYIIKQEFMAVRGG
ncbi:Uncharacterised protein [Vibrio cholerae]|nr:Uncharacterised protein [Vibrio cholerae]CSC70480.1 Uncharacterised protein [Vibrio cholerae]